MRKELVTSLVFTIAYFLLIILFRDWLELLYFPFWIGGLVGVVLPLVDYLINIYVLRADGDLSDVATKLTDRRSVLKNLENMSRTRVEHKDLIFHTAHFQLIFSLFTFWMVSSSGSLFGMGLSLAFLLHLFIDQVNDFAETGTIKHWFAKFNVNLSKRDEKLYMAAHLILLIVFGFFI